MNEISLDNKMKEIIKNYYEKCIGCNKCFKVCPMINKFTSDSKNLLEKFKNDKKMDKDLAFSCMLCDRCREVCPKEIDFKRIFFMGRKRLFITKKRELKSLGYTIVKFHQKNTFSSFFSSNYINKNSKKAFVPGCALTSYNSEIILNIFNYLKMNLGDMSILFECCGKPTLDFGDEQGFKKYYSKLDNVIKENSIKEVIVACENCYKVIKENSPNIKVVSLYEVVGKRGIPLELINKYKNKKETYALHDPCPIKEETNIHNSVRKILNELSLGYIEFEKNREQTECCGFGGMVFVTNKELASEQMKKRANSTEAYCIISYCESCVEAMKIGGKKSVHILDLLFNHKIIVNEGDLNQSNNGLIKKWITRKITINKFKEIFKER